MVAAGIRDEGDVRVAQARLSMQELIGRRKRAGFVGRRNELDLFRGNFDTSPEDERHSFVFHIHGTAGVGKSSLVRELEAVATQRKALTACTDETVNSAPEAMAAISAQFARQGVELKALDKLLASYRQRRHEAETASGVLEPGPGGAASPPPSAGSMAMAQAGLIGLGMVPGVGVFAGAVDPNQVAYGTDRLRAALSMRFRNHDDVQLVLEPLKVLTPVFVSELDRVAADIPWIALFFDTYERTAPFLDAWLLDLVTTDRYGALPANVILTMAGQQGPDPARWGDYAGFVTELALEPFTESEARQLLAAKQVVDEDVVREVLRLSGGLPVLVSTLAKNPGGGAGTVGDPSATAVERFLKWERDPARRAVALACALPRWLDEDVFRAAVDDGEAEGAYDRLRGLPFVTEREGRVRYHDVVRTAMLRLQRTRAPRQWAEAHARLAEVFGRWRGETEEGWTGRSCGSATHGVSCGSKSCTTCCAPGRGTLWGRSSRTSSARVTRTLRRLGAARGCCPTWGSRRTRRRYEDGVVTFSPRSRRSRAESCPRLPCCWTGPTSTRPHAPTCTTPVGGNCGRRATTMRPSPNTTGP